MIPPDFLSEFGFTLPVLTDFVMQTVRLLFWNQPRALGKKAGLGQATDVHLLVEEPLGPLLCGPLLPVGSGHPFTAPIVGALSLRCA